MHRLEESGAIKIFTNIIYQVKPLFNKSHSKIIEKNPKYEMDLKKIFSCDFFKNSRRTWLVLEELVDQTGLNYFRILEILNHLRKNGYLKFSEIMRKDLIWIKDKINDFDISPLVNLFDSILNHDLSKVDLLIKSLTKHGCIRKNILEYFNEPHLRDNCEMCSYCVGDKLAEEIEPEINENYASDEEIKNLIDLELYSYKQNLPLTLLISVAQNMEIEEKDFVKILVGKLHKLSSKWKFELDCYGILDNFKNQEIVLEELLKGLIDKELISEEIDGALRITKKGINYLCDNLQEKRAEVKSKKEIPIDLPVGVERTQIKDRFKSNYHEKLEKTKEKYPNAYEPWTSEADEKIKQLYNQGKSNSELSKIFQRRSGAIRSRLKKIGLIE